jgi:hypothetical protein
VNGPLPAEVVAEFLARCRSEWAEAGLPAHIDDPTVLDRIAAIVTTERQTVTTN